MEQHVLVVFPHPDDEAFGAAGTIALLTEKNTPVTYICGTLGEMGRNMGNPLFANRESLPSIRKKELEKSCEVLGVKDLRLLGLRDKTLEFENLEKIADTIESAINELGTTLIITFYPKYGVHPDHDACSDAVVKAVKRLPKDKRPKVHGIAIAKTSKEDLGEPNIINDIKVVGEKKMEAIMAHSSQFAGVIAGLEKGYASKDPEIMKWLEYERFWTVQID